MKFLSMPDELQMEFRRLLVTRRIVHSKVLPRKKWPAFDTIEATKEFYEAKIQEKLRLRYEVKVRGWLESGTLKGYRPTSGRWKITPADLMAFARDHRDLLRSG